jgi:hypothetical protein
LTTLDKFTLVETEIEILKDIQVNEMMCFFNILDIDFLDDSKICEKLAGKYIANYIKIGKINDIFCISFLDYLELNKSRHYLMLFELILVYKKIIFFKKIIVF